METRTSLGLSVLGNAFAKAQALGRPRALALEHEVGPAAEPLGRFPRSGLGPDPSAGAPWRRSGSGRDCSGPRPPDRWETVPGLVSGRHPSTRPSPPPRRGRPGAFRHTVRPRPRPAPERAHRRAVDRSQCRTVARQPRTYTAPRATRPARADAVRAIVRATPIGGYIACRQAIAKLNLTHRLPGTPIPTMVVVGVRSRTTVEMARTIHKGVAGSELVILKKMLPTCSPILQPRLDDWRGMLRASPARGTPDAHEAARGAHHVHAAGRAW